MFNYWWDTKHAKSIEFNIFGVLGTNMLERAYCILTCQNICWYSTVYTRLKCVHPCTYVKIDEDTLNISRRSVRLGGNLRPQNHDISLQQKNSNFSWWRFGTGGSEITAYVKFYCQDFQLNLKSIERTYCVEPDIYLALPPTADHFGSKSIHSFSQLPKVGRLILLYLFNQRGLFRWVDCHCLPVYVA